MGRNKKFVTIPVTEEVKERLRKIKQKHSMEYTSYDKMMRYAIMLLDSYSPHIIMRCFEPVVIREIPADTPKSEIPKILNSAIDEEHRRIKEDLRG